MVEKKEENGEERTYRPLLSEIWYKEVTAAAPQNLSAQGISY